MKHLIVILIILMIPLIMAEENMTNSTDPEFIIPNETNVTIPEISLKWVVIPDTQIYSSNETNDILINMSNWILEYNPDFIIHVGDIVQDPREKEYAYINEGLSILEDYNKFIALGNHDLNISLANESVNRSKFGMINEDLGVIVLDWEEDITYTKEVLQNNSNASFILVTHYYSCYGDYFDSIVNNSNVILSFSGHLNGHTICKENKTDGFNYNIMNGHTPLEIGKEEDGFLVYYEWTNETIKAVSYSPILNISMIEYVINLTDSSITWIKEMPIIEEPIRESYYTTGGGSGGGSSSKSKKLETNETNNTMSINEVQKQMMLKQFEEQKQNVSIEPIIEESEEVIVTKEVKWYVRIVYWIRGLI